MISAKFSFDLKSKRFKQINFKKCKNLIQLSIRMVHIHDHFVHYTFTYSPLLLNTADMCYMCVKSCIKREQTHVQLQSYFNIWIVQTNVSSIWLKHYNDFLFFLYNCKYFYRNCFKFTKVLLKMISLCVVKFKKKIILCIYSFYLNKKKTPKYKK